MRKRMSTVLAGRMAEPEPADRPAPERWPVREPVEIGGLRLENRLVQAPLAGIANWAFRRQSRRHGAGFAVSEMIASFGIRYANRKTLGMLTIVPDEHPVGVQVFGADVNAMVEAARAVEAAGADLVDINMGCPVPKICKTGAGAALLADPVAAARIVEAMVRAVDVPVTVKMRRGLTPSHLGADRDRASASRRPARRRCACTRAPRPRSTAGVRTTASRPRWWRPSASR